MQKIGDESAKLTKLTKALAFTGFPGSQGFPNSTIVSHELCFGSVFPRSSMVFWIIFSEVLSKALVASSFAVKSVSDKIHKIPQNTKDHESGDLW